MNTTTLRVSEDTLTRVNERKKDKQFLKQFPEATSQDGIVKSLDEFWRIQKTRGGDKQADNETIIKLEIDNRELAAEVEKLEKEKEAILATDSAFLEGFAKEKGRIETAKNNREAAQIKADATIGAAQIRGQTSIVNTAMKEAGKEGNFSDMFGKTLGIEKLIPAIFTPDEPKKLESKETGGE